MRVRSASSTGALAMSPYWVTAKPEGGSESGALESAPSRSSASSAKSKAKMAGGSCPSAGCFDAAPAVAKARATA
ncbi:MAG: hypothetical protein NTX64_04165, partial [Elusimicrobia bacterium]|nr:hypothetical protein [Elusimicrobiota bacterium]